MILRNHSYLKVYIFNLWFDQPLRRDKIAPNLIKIGFHAYLSNGYLNPLSKLNSKKLDKSAYSNLDRGPK